MSAVRDRGTRALLDLRDENPDAQAVLRQVVKDQIMEILANLRDAPPSDEPPSFSQLVQDAFDGVIDSDQVSYVDRVRFKAVASEVAEEAVAELLEKARDSREPVRLPTRERNPSSLNPVQTEQLLSLDRALKDLATLDPRLRSMAIWHYYGGLDEVELAQYLRVSEASVRRDLIKARGLIYKGFRQPS